MSKMAPEMVSKIEFEEIIGSALQFLDEQGRVMGAAQLRGLWLCWQEVPEEEKTIAIDHMKAELDEPLRRAG